MICTRRFVKICCLVSMVGFTKVITVAVSAMQSQPAVPTSTAPASDRAESDHGGTDDEKSAPPADSITEHSITLGSASLDYRAHAGTVTLKDEDGKEKANIFFIAYTVGEADKSASRPITFCFNGGPGSSSVWLHLGAFGPRRVEMGDAGSLVPPPWKLIDNESTLLDLTDLVFIDPVTTGYSRAVPPDDDDRYHGVNEDIEAVGEFIRLYATRYGRWNSPKFLAGESYGTTRAAGLAGHLQTRHGMHLNGVILISAVLNFQTTSFARGNDLAYPLYLPTFTATAWHHGQLNDELQADFEGTMRQAEEFAIGEYTLALAKGNQLSAEERRRIAEKLSQLTGLSQDFVAQCNLRVSLSRFSKELLREQRKTVGRLDSRFMGIDADAAGESVEYDPSYAAIQGPYTATINDYVRRDLGYESDLNYEILTSRVSPWNYSSVQNRYLNVAETLRSAMTQNQAMRVFVAGGYFDAATPYFAAEYTMNHLGLEPHLDGNITFRHYPAGHMMYVHEPSLVKLKTDLAEYYGDALRR